MRLQAGGAWISTVVLAEVSWVLRAAYRFDRATIAEALRRLLISEGVWTESAAAVLRALDSFEAGPADFADYLILETARSVDALPLNTFDERLATASGAQSV